MLENVIKPLGLSITEAARDLGISRKMLSEIVNGKNRISPELAVRIAKATNTSPESWLAMQNKLDLWNAMQNEPKNVIRFEESITVTP